MSAHHLIQYLSWLVFLLLFTTVTIAAVLRPWRVNIDIALFFGAPAAIILIGSAIDGGLIANRPALVALTISLLLSISYLLLRLVDDFADLRPALLRIAEVALVFLSAATFALAQPAPAWLTVLQLLYLIIPLGYVAWAFWYESRRTNGVTRRRMRAAAAGSLLLVVVFLFASLPLVAPAYTTAWQMLADLSGLAAGICYFLGFAPPRSLRRAWQEPELRAFLGRAVRLPRLTNTQAIIGALEQGTADSLGTPNASVGLWDEAAQVLRFGQEPNIYIYRPAREQATGRAWLEQQTAFNLNSQLQEHGQATQARRYGVRWVLAAPISSGARQIGVLVVYAARTPLFADDDLALIKLLADQASVILDSRMLIDQAARVQAREEASRLKDDFLSAAAHDLKTPLTTLVARAQLLERRARRNPAAPADLVSIRALVQEGNRLRRLVTDLLDATRTERGLLVGQRSPVDLAAVARGVCARYSSPLHHCLVEAPETLVGNYDPARIEQLLDNLVENAVKYSPVDSTIRVIIVASDGQAQIRVCDEGIGIAEADLPHIFERFYRGSNVEDGGFTGIGLGLFICHSIVAQHGGQITVSSRPAQGTTFSINLPLLTATEIEKVYA